MRVLMVSKLLVWRRLDVVICPSMCMKRKFDRMLDFRGRMVHLHNIASSIGEA